MAKQHSKQTIIYVEGVDISQYCDNSQFSEGADVHDTTGYGSDAHAQNGGLKKHSFSLGGTYSTTATGTPKAVFGGKSGDTLTIIRLVEGEGASKPAETFDAVLTSYVVSNPVADYVRWTAQLEVDGDVDRTVQAS